MTEEESYATVKPESAEPSTHDSIKFEPADTFSETEAQTVPPDSEPSISEGTEQDGIVEELQEDLLYTFWPNC